MVQDRSVKLAGVTAAVTATAAAGYYAYDQYAKRYPRYQQQLALYQEVSVGPAISSRWSWGHTNTAPLATKSL